MLGGGLWIHLACGGPDVSRGSVRPPALCDLAESSGGEGYTLEVF